ncbi:hypothetical protein [Yoonia sp. BS5-3]|uniref:Uncharacterized protein n=1 Tax=Yoonia phaeophyticola TaxID=3137369 RepID=A0ABZ2V764_9RHOB
MKQHILELVWFVSVAACVGIGCGFLTGIIGRLASVNFLGADGFGCGFTLCLAALIFRKWHRMFPPLNA